MVQSVTPRHTHARTHARIHTHTHTHCLSLPPSLSLNTYTFPYILNPPPLPPSLGRLCWYENSWHLRLTICCVIHSGVLLLCRIRFFFRDIADLALLRRALRHVFFFPIFNQQDEACTCSDCSARSCGGSYRLGRSPWPWNSERRYVMPALNFERPKNVTSSLLWFSVQANFKNMNSVQQQVNITVRKCSSRAFIWVVTPLGSVCKI